VYGSRIRGGVGLVALLVMAAACGGAGDDDVGLGGAVGQDSTAPPGGLPADGGGVGGDGDVDPCSLLEVADVESQFGERGTVADGQTDFSSCIWEVGDQTQEDSGNVYVTDYPPVGQQSPREQFATLREMTDSAVDVEGLGDEAFFQLSPLEESPMGLLETGIVTIRQGDLVLDVGANFGPPSIADSQDRLMALAARVLERL
jgi:hypothetical protein